MTTLTPETRKRLDEIFQPLNRGDAPGAVVGVALGGVPVYRRGFGLASIEHGVANTPATRMRIGSTSKHFTCLAVLLLAEDGKLDVGQGVGTYLPELNALNGAPTLRELMHHTSGLRDPLDFAGLLLAGYHTMYAPGAEITLAARFTSSNFPRGERMIYCNYGYYLLSLVVQRVAGVAFEEFLKQRIFAPLGMNDTVSLRNDLTIVPNIATFHLPQPDGTFRRGIYPTEELLGSGAMVSSIDDMLKWMAHLRADTKVVGSAATWRAMLERPRYSSGAEGGYALGLYHERYRGVDTVHHAGAVLGCVHQMLTVPSKALDITIMSNRMDGGAPGLAMKVVDALLGDALEAAVPPLKAGEHAAIEGRWFAPGQRRLYSVVAQPLPDQSKVLAFAVHDGPVGLLRRKDDDTYYALSPAHGTVELRAGEVSDSGHVEPVVRLPAEGPPAAELAAGLVGRYRYADFDLDLEMILEDGKLVLDLLPAFGRMRIALTPYSADVLGGTYTASWPVPLVTGATFVVERKAGKVAGLWASSARTRNLWLERVSSRA